MLMLSGTLSYYGMNTPLIGKIIHFFMKLLRWLSRRVKLYFSSQMKGSSKFSRWYEKFAIILFHVSPILLEGMEEF
jgi:hypothetical protein